MRSAFSLVELSIVLVILGLLTGGILAGQSLIRAAELRSVTKEIDQYKQAVNAFTDKYLAVPGDMANAESFWGTVSVTDSVCRATNTNDMRTCNGNGDGQVRTSGWARSYEDFRFWQQLANAGLIPGSYSGVPGTMFNYNVDLGINAPRSSFKDAGWSHGPYLTWGSYSGSITNYAMRYGNALIFGADFPPYGSNVLEVLTPSEAWNIDKKIDDGLPARGWVISSGWNNTCAAADDGSHSNGDYNASYKLSSDEVACWLLFRNLWGAS